MSLKAKLSVKKNKSLLQLLKSKPKKVRFSSLYPTLLAIGLLACNPTQKVASTKKMNNSSATVQFIEKEAEKKVDVLIKGELFTSYIYPSSIAKPVLYPLITKSGQKLTRGYPLDPQAGERNDHPHHIGYWLNYGDVNGFDFWNNSFNPKKNRKYGLIQHQEIVKLEEAKGLMEVSAKWISDEKEALLREQTQFYFSEKAATRQIDRITTLTALTDVDFTDNKEGMLAVRVIRALELPSKKAAIYLDENGRANPKKIVNNDGVIGDYLSSEGKTGQKVWGTRAKWMHLHSQLNKEPISLTIIDHPDNVGYPTYWHARGYGLFAANPLGQKAMSKGKEILNFKLKKGQSVTFKYRLLVQGGNELSKADLEAAFTDFSKR